MGDFVLSFPNVKTPICTTINKGRMKEEQHVRGGSKQSLIMEAKEKQKEALKEYRERDFFKSRDLYRHSETLWGRLALEYANGVVEFKKFKGNEKWCRQMRRKANVGVINSPIGYRE